MISLKDQNCYNRQDAPPERNINLELPLNYQNTKRHEMNNNVDFNHWELIYGCHEPTGK